jgi:ABC-type multidrug transport system ATPase subunit
MIKIKNLTYKTGKDTIIKNFTIDVPNNSVTVLIGNNGAGKTTLIKCIIGFLKISSGSAEIDNINVSDKRSRVGVGYLLEKEIETKNISCLNFLQNQAAFTGKNKQEIEKLIHRYVVGFGFPADKMKVSINLLSSGLRKTLMLINTFILGEKLIILDEPTEFLDPKTRKALNKEILEAKKDGKTIMLSTHDLSGINSIADYVVIIDSRKIKYSDKIDKKINLNDFFETFYKSK